MNCDDAAFAKGWDMTLVICATIPLLAGVAGTISIFIGRITSQQSEAYGVANGIASEALAAIRTVLSFNGEDCTVRRYGMSLTRPLQVGIKGGFLNGIVLGFANCCFLCIYALALWYGGTRVRAGKYTGTPPHHVIFDAASCDRQSAHPNCDCQAAVVSSIMLLLNAILCVENAAKCVILGLRLLDIMSSSESGARCASRLGL